MDTSKFSCKEAVRFGWDMMKANFWFFVGLLVAAFIIKIIPSQLAEVVKKDNKSLYFIFTLISIFFSILVDMGIVRTSLKISNQEKGDVFDLFNCYPLFFKYLWSTILYGLMVIGGFILLVVPGVIVAIRGSMYRYLIIDKGLGPLEAIKESFRLTKGSGWDLFVLYCLLVGINILGLLALVLGLFATIPVGMIASVFVYRKLLGVVSGDKIQLTREV